MGALGARTTGGGDCVEVHGVSDNGSPGPSCDPGDTTAVSVGESGTLLRFLTAAAATVREPITITGSGRIRRRPVAGLVVALETLGADIETTEGFAPLTVRSGRLGGGEVRVAATQSSQFASALLLAAPRATGGVSIGLEGEPVSASYLDLTVSVMARCGVSVERPEPHRFRVAPGRAVPARRAPDLGGLDHGELFLRSRRHRAGPRHGGRPRSEVSPGGNEASGRS